MKNYRELVRLVDGQDFAGAGALLATMEAEERLNRYETAFLWWAKYVTTLGESARSDLAQMRRALERAVSSEEACTCRMVVRSRAAERLVVLHAQASDIAAAMAMFERLRDKAAEFADGGSCNCGLGEQIHGLLAVRRGPATGVRGDAGARREQTA